MSEILILYYSHRGSVRALAERVARGVESVPGMQARLRTVPKVSTVCEASEATVPTNGAPYVEAIDLEECVGLAFGSPRFPQAPDDLEGGEGLAGAGRHDEEDATLSLGNGLDSPVDRIQLVITRQLAGGVVVLRKYRLGAAGAR